MNRSESPPAWGEAPNAGKDLAESDVQPQRDWGGPAILHSSPCTHSAKIAEIGEGKHPLYLPFVPKHFAECHLLPSAAVCFAIGLLWAFHELGQFCGINTTSQIVVIVSKYCFQNICFVQMKPRLTFPLRFTPCQQRGQTLPNRRAAGVGGKRLPAPQQLWNKSSLCAF